MGNCVETASNVRVAMYMLISILFLMLANFAVVPFLVGIMKLICQAGSWKKNLALGLLGLAGYPGFLVLSEHFLQLSMSIS